MVILKEKSGRFITGFVAIIGLVVLIVVLLQYEKPDYPVKRAIRYSLTLQNNTNDVKQNIDFWVFSPARETSIQHVVNLEASDPYDVVVDKAGNHVLHFKIAKMPPFATKIINIKVNIELTDKPNKKNLLNKDIYLVPAPYIESNDSRIKELATNLKGSTVRETAANILKWVNNNLTYIGYVKDDRGAVYALKNRKGDCTEYMYLFTALARAAGIPSRGVGGYIISEDAVLKPEELHNWSEIYIDNAWQSVDPQNGVFLKNQSHYISMRIIGVSNNTPYHLSTSHQFATSSNSITIKMN